MLGFGIDVVKELAFVWGGAGIIICKDSGISRTVFKDYGVTLR